MSERFLRRTVDGEQLWVDLERGQFYGLNETAARILDLVRDGVTEPDRIAEHLATEFEVSLDEARAAAKTLLEEARRRELTDV